MYYVVMVELESKGLIDIWWWTGHRLQHVALNSMTDSRAIYDANASATSHAAVDIWLDEIDASSVSSGIAYHILTPMYLV